MPGLTRPELRRRRTGATLPSRRTPEARSPKGMPSRFDLKGRVPGRHYVWVYQGSDDAKGQYESSGYRYEKWDFKLRNGKPVLNDQGVPVSNGVHPPGANAENHEQGKTLKVGDFCLMSCDKQRKADIDEYGHDGATGQVLGDLISDRVIKHNRGNDPLRGLGNFRRGKHIDVETYGEHGAEHGHTEVTQR